VAQKIHIVLEDDIDGTEATETVTFGLDGTAYEIDLNDANAAKLRDALAAYIGHGRKVGAAPRRGGRRAAANEGTSAKEIREWARSNGFDVPERGRVSAEVRSAYEKAN
jgi:hypothetical protein